MIYLFLADGFEECEALVPLDILRRANVEIKTVGITSRTVIGAHNISLNCDLAENETNFENLEGIILPGGMPGTINLKNNETVNKFIDFAAKNNLVIGAICAAPSILGEKGLLNGKNATCFPGFEGSLLGSNFTNKAVVKDKNYITAIGAGAAFEFGFCLLETLRSKKEADDLKLQMKFIGE